MAPGCMVRCCTCVSIFIVLGVVFFTLALFLLPCMPPYVHFPEYTSAVKGTPLEDSGYHLNGVEQLAQGELRGPQALAVRDGQIYTGLLGGRIVRVDSDSNVETVSRLGHPNCETETEGEPCGRPMGMQFHQDKLYVVDAYHGLYRVDVDTGQWEHLTGGTQRIGGLMVMLACDLAVAKDGRVFWTDASTQTNVENVLLELLAEPSGRLLRYDPATNRTDTLIGKVHCAAGVLLAPDESFLLVAEAGKDRILRYHLKGEKAGTHDIFAEGLPGIPVKISSFGDGYLVTLVVEHPSFVSWIRHHPSLGRALMRFFASVKTVFSSVNNIAHNNVSRDAVYMMGNPQLISDLLDGGAVITLDREGRMLSGAHSNDKKLGMISQVELLDDSLYFASPYNPYLGRLNFTDRIRDKLLGNATDNEASFEATTPQYQEDISTLSNQVDGPDDV